MLKFIKEELSHVTDKYAVELKKFHDALALKQKELEKHILEVRRQNGVLKDQEKSNNRKLKIEVEKLVKEQTEVINIKTQLGKEISKHNKLNNTLSFNKSKSDLALSTVEGERDLAIDERRKQEAITKNYELKTTLLGTDSKRLEKKRTEHDQREDALRLKEKVFDKKERERINKEHILGARDLWIQTQEKRIKLELTKLKLK